MFSFPTLAESMRVADNRFKFNQLTGRFNTDWSGAERQAQAMQPQAPAEPPPDPGQQRLGATTVNPLTGRREWKPGAGPATGLPGAGFQKVNPMGGDPGQWDAHPVPFGGGGISPDRNPRGGGADPFDPGSKFDPGSGRYYANGGMVMPGHPAAPQSNPGGLWHGPGGPKDDQIHAKVSPGEYEMPFEAVMYHGTKKLDSMREEAMENGPGMGSMPGSKSPRLPVSKSSEMMPGPGMMPSFAEGGPVPSLEDMRFRGYAARANLDNANAGFPDLNAGAPMSFPVPAPAAPAPAPMVDPNFPNGTPPLNGGSFMAPWEKDALARAELQANVIPGLNRTGTRRFNASPQGVMWNLNAAQDQQNQQLAARAAQIKAAQDAAEWNRQNQITFGQSQQAAAAAAKRTGETWQQQYERKQRDAAATATQPPQDIPGTNYVRTPFGNLPKALPAPTVPPGMVPDSMTVGGVRYKAPAAEKPARGRIVMQGDTPIMLNPDGTYQPAVNLKPTDKQKAEAFKAQYQRDPKSDDDWSEAWYLASGKEKTAPAAAPVAGASGPGTSPGSQTPATNANISQEAYAKLKPGDSFTWNGQTLTKK